MSRTKFARQKSARRDLKNESRDEWRRDLHVQHIATNLLLNSAHIAELEALLAHPECILAGWKARASRMIETLKAHPNWALYPHDERWMHYTHARLRGLAARRATGHDLSRFDALAKEPSRYRHRTRPEKVLPAWMSDPSLLPKRPPPRAANQDDET